MDVLSGLAILIEEAPDFEFKGQHVHIVDKCGVRRAMPRSVAIQAYARFAQRLREDRLGKEAAAKLGISALEGGAEIITLPKR